MFTEAREHSRPLSLVTLDIDHFKQVNDTFGHAVGDAVLVRLARLMMSSRRPGDVIGRLGGEEFLWALPRLDESASSI